MLSLATYNEDSVHFSKLIFEGFTGIRGKGRNFIFVRHNGVKHHHEDRLVCRQILDNGGGFRSDNCSCILKGPLVKTERRHSRCRYHILDDCCSLLNRWMR